MTTVTTTTKHISDADRLAALRHGVYDLLLAYLPPANYDQTRQLVVNLQLCRGMADDDPARHERRINAAMMRFVSLKVTPDINRMRPMTPQLIDIERFFNAKYGERLAHVAGFYRRNDTAPFRLNLPFNCAMYGYRSDAGFYNGVLCQPLDRTDFYFLLSSSKYGYQKALRLTPRDQQYFTQFEEVRI